MQSEHALYSIQNQQYELASRAQEIQLAQMTTILQNGKNKHVLLCVIYLTFMCMICITICIYVFVYLALNLIPPSVSQIKSGIANNSALVPSNSTAEQPPALNDVGTLETSVEMDQSAHGSSTGGNGTDAIDNTFEPPPTPGGPSATLKTRGLPATPGTSQENRQNEKDPKDTNSTTVDLIDQVENVQQNQKKKRSKKVEKQISVPSNLPEPFPKGRGRCPKKLLATMNKSNECTMLKCFILPSFTLQNIKCHYTESLLCTYYR